MVMLVSEEKNYEEYLDSKEWAKELKRDGNRIDLVVYNAQSDNPSIEFYNRKGEIYSKDIPKEIINTLRESLANDNYIDSFRIDGELTFTDEKGIDHRTQAQCPDAEPILWMWDITELNGEDLRPLKWVERKLELQTVCDIYGWTYEEDCSVRYLPHYLDGRGLLKIAEDNNMEGIVLKKVDAPYEEGKSKNQIKIKFTNTDDYIVIGYVNAKNTKTGKREKYFGSLILAQYKQNNKSNSIVSIENYELVPKGRVGIGFEDSDLIKITEILQREINDGNTRHFIDEASENKDNYANFTDKNYNLPKNTINWLDCNDWFVIEIKMSGYTEYNKPYQPRFLYLRDDKNIEDCIENEI